MLIKKLACFGILHRSNLKGFSFLKRIRYSTRLAMSRGRLRSLYFDSLLTPQLIDLERLFAKKGFSLRFVGGVVRDLMLGQNPKDVDLATDCTPEEMIKLFDAAGVRYFLTGLQHGTITVHIDETKMDYEITTLRVDEETDGRHAIVNFTQDWKLDAQRRDLTINAMSLDFQGKLYDYFEGQLHLEERKIVFVGDPVDRIKEDYLRILRYFRFYGKIAENVGCHDIKTLQSIRSLSYGLKKIAVERIWMEVQRILSGNHAPHLLQMMYDTGVASHIGLPDKANFQEFNRVWLIHHKTRPLQPVTLLITLVDTEEDSIKLTSLWKLSNNDKHLATYVASNRQEAGSLENDSREYFQLQLVDQIPKAWVTEVLYYSGQHALAEELAIWPIPVFPVSGKDLIYIGLKPGPKYGILLKDLKKIWKESRFTLNKEELLERLKTLL